MNRSPEHLTGAVQNVLDRLGEIPHGLLLTVFLVLGLAATATSIRSGLICQPAARRPWAAVAATCLLWTAGYAGLLVGLPPWCIWLIIHPVTLVFVGVGILAFPGVQRSATGWALVVSDGWMSVGGVATVAWIVLQPVMRAAGRSPIGGMLIWAAIDFLVASMLAGLLVTAPPGIRRTILPIMLAATLAGVGDLCLALTGGREVTTLVWIVVTGLLGLGALIGGPNLFLSAFAGETQTRVITLSQLPLVPCVIFLFAPFEHDLVGNLLAGMVVAVAFGNVAMHSKQNAALVDRVRQDSDRLAHQARTDPLTGLLNRAALMAAIGEQLRDQGRATLLFIDLDEFKAVNDTLGHAAGDDVLIQVSAQLREAMGTEAGGGMGADDGIARLGGDEFAVLVGPHDRRDPAQIAAAVLAGMAQIRTPEHLSPGHASIGIASGPATSPDELLRDADLAMYQAKAAGGDVAIAFELWMRERMLERSRLRAELEAVIIAGGLSLALQPVVDLATGRWHGFEALVRWPDDPHPRMPDAFLPLAEETDLILPLGRWVLSAALGFLSAWDDAQVRDDAQLRGEAQLDVGAVADRPSIAVNVSPRQLEGADFADEVLAALAAHDIAPNRLILEITEQAAVRDFSSAVPRLKSLRESGVHISIDDFGTGYSSLRYLTRLPVDQLKIDQQFVAGLGVRSEDEVLVTTMLRLARELGLEVVAEGVETAEQAQLLLIAGCRLVQGYLFSKPIPIEQLIPTQQPTRREGTDHAVPRPRSDAAADSPLAGFGPDSS